MTGERRAHTHAAMLECIGSTVYFVSCRASAFVLAT